MARRPWTLWFAPEDAAERALKKATMAVADIWGKNIKHPAERKVVPLAIPNFRPTLSEIHPSDRVVSITMGASFMLTESQHAEDGPHKYHAVQGGTVI